MYRTADEKCECGHGLAGGEFVFQDHNEPLFTYYIVTGVDANTPAH